MPKTVKKLAKAAAYPEKALHALYEERHFKQDDLAEAIGCSRQIIGKYMSGETKPPADVLAKMAEYFNVSSDYLLGLTSNPTIAPDMQAAIKKTGLSQKAIEKTFICHYSDGGDVLNMLLETDEMYVLLEEIYTYLKMVSQPYEYSDDVKKAANLLNDAGYFYITPELAADLQKQQLEEDFSILLDIITERNKQ